MIPAAAAAGRDLLILVLLHLPAGHLTLVSPHHNHLDHLESRLGHLDHLDNPLESPAHRTLTSRLSPACTTLTVANRRFSSDHMTKMPVKFFLGILVYINIHITYICLQKLSEPTKTMDCKDIVKYAWPHYSHKCQNWATAK